MFPQTSGISHLSHVNKGNFDWLTRCLVYFLTGIAITAIWTTYSFPTRDTTDPSCLVSSEDVHFSLWLMVKVLPLKQPVTILFLLFLLAKYIMPCMVFLKTLKWLPLTYGIKTKVFGKYMNSCIVWEVIPWQSLPNYFIWPSCVTWSRSYNNPSMCMDVTITHIYLRN